MDTENLLTGLHKKRNEIIKQWTLKVKSRFADGTETESELRNHIPDFLDSIEETLEFDHRDKEVSNSQARSHGQQRYRLGFDLKSLVQEYGLLRNVILDVISADGTSIAYSEIRRLSDCILGAIAEAVEEHSLQERQEKERSHAAEIKHMQERAEFEQYLGGIVSHDLRNPLSAIALTAVSIRRQQEIPERVKKKLDRIIKSTDNALRLVEDILDFTRIRLGNGIPVERKLCSLRSIVESTAEEIKHARPDTRINVACSGDPQGDWDANRIGQVIQNLLLNALQHADPPGQVQVDIDDDGTDVKLACTNPGPPINAAQLEHIFEPMTQGEQRHAHSGLGLGLYIVSHIVKAHAGSISVTSTESAGTTFTAHLPRFKSENP